QLLVCERHDRDCNERRGEVQEDEDAARPAREAAARHVVELRGRQSRVGDEDLGRDQAVEEPDEERLTPTHPAEAWRFAAGSPGLSAGTGLFQVFPMDATTDPRPPRALEDPSGRR